MTEKRFQELSTPYQIYLWIRWMPIGYIRAFWWYFVKRLKWEDVCGDDTGRISFGTCVGICIGLIQHDMKWYYNEEEIFGEEGELKEIKKGFLENATNFMEDKFVELIDGKMDI